MFRRTHLLCVLFASSSAVTLPAALAETSIDSIGWLDARDRFSLGFAISDDGKVVAGQSDDSPLERAFRWTQGGGIQDLGTFDQGAEFSWGAAYGVSGDGQFVVGQASTPDPQGHAFRWTADSGLQDLGTLPYSGDAYSAAYAASADGRVVVGTSSERAFRWTPAGGMEDLGSFWPNDGKWFGVAQDVSADGRVIIGWAGNLNGSKVESFRWTPAEGIRRLGTLPGRTNARHYALGVSADGRVVVGSSNDVLSTPFAWTAKDGMQALPIFDKWGGANAVSGDGRIVVGDSDSEACIWVDGVPHLLWDLLKQEFGVDPARSGWEGLSVVHACSADGLNLAGTGFRRPRGTSAFRVLIDNRRPTAKAGRDIVVTTSSESGARVKLDGSDSFDPDRNSLGFSWSSSVKLTPRDAVRPTGQFPIGTRTAKLTVSDVLGEADTDRVNVTVRLNNAQLRPRGEQANALFEAAGAQMRSDFATGDASAGRLAAFERLELARAWGDATGPYVRWEEGQSPQEARVAYAELRARQLQVGSQAASALVADFVEMGDASLLSACDLAVQGVLFAAADLAQP